MALCWRGFTQTINDYYDREIDAINEPYRPIPSGAIPLGQVKLQIWVLLLAGLGVSYGLDSGPATALPCLPARPRRSFVSYIYSAPPLKLKQNGLAGELRPRRQLHRPALVGPARPCLGS